MADHSSRCMYLPLFHQPLPGLVHASLTSNGGRSLGPFAGNNVSFGVGDDVAAIRLNRQRIKAQFGLRFLVSAHQVHGDAIYHVQDPVAGDQEAEGYDALITDQEGVGLLVQHADCQAVMIYDQPRRVVAAVHNGWRGSVVNIVAGTLAEMKRLYGTDPADIVAGIGPSLGPCCSEFVNYRDELPDSFQPFQVQENYFDFWKITEAQLLQSGVRREAITIAGICTSCSDIHFSYRRACRNGSPVTGRNGTVIALV